MTDDQREDMILDLPDFTSGNLSSTRMKEIAQALTHDAELQEELEEIQTLKSAMQSEFKGLSYEGLEANEDRLAKVVATAKRAPAKSAAVKTEGKRSGLLDLIYGGNVFKPAFAVAAGLLAVQTLSPNSPDDYNSLSGPDANSRPADFIIQFSDDATLSDIKALIADHDLTFVAGPNGDFFELATSQEDTDALLATLSEDSIIQTILPKGEDE